MKLVLLSVFVFCGVNAVVAAEWTNAKGVTITADFVSLSGNDLKIVHNEKICTVPLSSLCATSREQARELAIATFQPATVGDVKRFWTSELRELSTLDRNYHKVKKANEKRRAEIWSGKYDDDASVVALRYNIHALLGLGAIAQAEVYQKQLAATQAIQQMEEQRAEQRSQIQNLADDIADEVAREVERRLRNGN